jgi:hypothetical protein
MCVPDGKRKRLPFIVRVPEIVPVVELVTDKPSTVILRTSIESSNYSQILAY